MGRIIILRLSDSYFRHRWLYLLPVSLMAIFGAIYFFSRERAYISSGVLFTEQSTLLSSLTSVQTEGYSWNTPAQDTANQISDLIKTDAFIRAVIGETDLEAEMSKGDAVVADTISEVRKKIWATVAGTNQVEISAAHPDPRVAFQLAQATIDTFIQWKINLDRIDSVTAGDFFQVLIEVYQSNVEEAQQALRSYLETHPEPVRGSRLDTEELEIQNLQAELDLAGTRLAQALNKAEDARLAEAKIESTIQQTYTVVDAPSVPDKPHTSRRQLAMNSAVFLAVGVLLSGIAVAGATVFERSFRLPVEVRQALALPVLAVVPDVSVRQQRSRKRSKETDTRTNEPIREGPEAAPVASDTPVQAKKVRSRSRKRKEPVTAEISEPGAEGLEEPPIVLDLEVLEVNFKAEQKVGN